jgi:DNA-binding response OmpR family regulator
MEKNSKLVAVFDDDQDLLNIFRFLFEDEGFDVQTFQDCDNVVEKVQAISPDLILMDNWIPGTGGEVAVQRLKSHADLKNIPIIYVSANNDVKEIAARAGADRFLAKPFEFDDLLALANELLQQK